MTCRHRRAPIVTHGPYVDALWCQGCGGLRLRRDGKWQRWLRPSLTHVAAERRGEESTGRRWNYRAQGALYEQTSGAWICQPLATWSAGEVWGYIAERGLPYNRRIYDAETHGLTRETIRNQGWLSTVHATCGHLAWLRTHFPAEWRALSSAFPQVREMA